MEGDSYVIPCNMLFPYFLNNNSK